mmetsp:Transcript_31251/g.76549  ORF Transcript_31251/g.76549 Transcript_31251/m.76549 type:complete len:250 (+) Transcript_31251:376-1125(+)
MRRARRPAATKTTKRKKRNTFITLRPKSTPLHPHPRQPRNTQRNKKRRRMKCKSCTIVVVTRDHLQKQLQRPRTRLRSHRHRAPQPHAHTTQAPHPRPTPTRTTKTSTASPTNHTATSSTQTPTHQFNARPPSLTRTNLKPYRTEFADRTTRPIEARLIILASTAVDSLDRSRERTAFLALLKITARPTPPPAPIYTCIYVAWVVFTRRIGGDTTACGGRVVCMVAGTPSRAAGVIRGTCERRGAFWAS